MTSHRRRRIEPKSDRKRLAELSTEARQLRFMAHLSVQVSQACDKWLRGRGIPPGAMSGEYPRHTVQSPPAPPYAPETGTGETGRPGGWVESLAAHAQTPRPPAFEHAHEIDHFPAITESPPPTENRHER